MTPLEKLQSVLCDPSGKCCIRGSDEDRKIVDDALAQLASGQEPVGEHWPEWNGAIEKRRNMTKVAPLPPHPEHHSMTWSSLERRAISEYAEQVAAPLLARIAAQKALLDLAARPYGHLLNQQQQNRERMARIKEAIAQIAIGQEPVSASPMNKRRVSDAIRGAYDLGYSDARNAQSIPGDSAPGYKGRDVEADHGSALINALYPAPAPAQQPIASGQLPVAEIAHTDSTGGYVNWLLHQGAPIKMGDKLFTHPAPSQPIASGREPRKIPIPPPGADPFDIVHAEGWNACCDAFFGGVAPLDPVVITITEAPAQQPLSDEWIAAFTKRGNDLDTHGWTDTDIAEWVTRQVEAALGIKEKQ
jgi:hypothetical protein